MPWIFSTLGNIALKNNNVIWLLRKNNLSQPERPDLPKTRCRATSRIFSCDLGTGFPTKVLKGKLPKNYLERYNSIVNTSN